jgi:hypothetical protein
VTPSAVARSGDVSAAAGTTPATGADSGTWTAGTLTLSTADLLSSDGRAVVVEAACTFSFTGKAGNTAVTDSSTVELKPGSPALLVGGTHPLLDGDAEEDDYGNTVSVSSDAALRTD